MTAAAASEIVADSQPQKLGVSPSEQWFQVSGRGNGAGLTVLAVRSPDTQARLRVLTIHTLPKLWRARGQKCRDSSAPDGASQQSPSPDPTKGRWISVPLDALDEDFSTLWLYEQDRLCLQGEWAQHLTRVATGVSQDPGGEEEDESLPEKDPLWKITVGPEAFTSAPDPVALSSAELAYPAGILRKFLHSGSSS